MRKLLMLLAAVAYLFVVAIELGSDKIFPPPIPSPAQFRQALATPPSDDGPKIDADTLAAQRKPSPPGLAILYTALLDGLVLLALARNATDPFLSSVSAITVRVLNAVFFVAGLVDTVLCVIMALLAFAALITMLSLLLAVPFGTIAYLIAFGFFATGTAVGILTALFVLKLIAVVLVLVAGQVSNRRLLVLLLCSLLASFLVSFLLGFPPNFLVSIFDALAAIIVAIIALLFALPMLISGLFNVIKGLHA